MSNITKGNLNGISSKGGYYKDGKFVPNAVSATDPLAILYGYPVNSTGFIIEAGQKSNKTYEDDGHGVLTARVTYYGSSAVNINIGDSHPKISALKCLRSSISQDGKVYTTTAEYIGLTNGSNVSKIIFSGDFGVGSAAIKTNKYFGDLKAITATGWDENNKEFTDKDDDYKLRGVKSYYTPTLTLSGYFYTNQKSMVSSMIQKVGTITNDIGLPSDEFSFYNNLPFSGSGITSLRYFVSGVSHETIANSLYKIKFSLIYSGDGWNNLIYDRS
jgi:hypothetical protein